MKTMVKQKSDEKQGLTGEVKEALKKTALTIRGLAMDATQKANSGHPGLPLGCAEIAAYLWGVFLHYNPEDPKWIARDRFILSAGHGCLLQYSALHLSGYPLTLEDIKQFRQLDSKTPGHPERDEAIGIETTTGPLGQGLGNAVGEALGFKLLQEKFGGDLFNNKVVCLAGDGCIMEGVTSEASSLAGHLQLDNLIILYDANNICLDGPLSECCSENTIERYKAYGFEVHEVDGYDFDALHTLFTNLREKQDKPVLILCHTIIGKGAPTKEGTHKAHGSPLGEEEVAKTKAALGLPEETFFVPSSVRDYFENHKKLCKAVQQDWEARFESWSKEHADLRKEFDLMHERKIPEDLEAKLTQFEMKAPQAGRASSHEVINFLVDKLPFLYGGSADLSGSDKTMMKNYPIVRPGIFSGRNIKFGVREFGMATMAVGMEQTDMMIPFIGTFLTFTDYMRNAIRLSALQHSHVIFQMTHDSIFLGEDGPTHQPVEHYAALRAIPNLHFIRPAGNHEVKMAWLAALYYKGPTVFALSRQNVAEIPETHVPYNEGMGKGAYVVKEVNGDPDYTLVATGSELPLALDVAKALDQKGHSARVVSMPCQELFDAQDARYKESLFGPKSGKCVSIEAGVSQGWHRYIGRDGVSIAVDTFGASAPASQLGVKYGFTVEQILERIV